MNNENEICIECDAITGNWGRDEDSLYYQFADREEGPYCRKCYDFIWNQRAQEAKEANEPGEL